MSKLTPDELMKLKTGDTTPAELEQSKKAAKLQTAINAMSTRDFLIGRTKETMLVPVRGLGGSKKIEVRVRLSKAEMKPFEKVMEQMEVSQDTKPKFETDEDERALAKFLEYITIDNALTTEFWLSEEIAPETADDILSAYFILEPARRMIDTQKFLGERLRAGVRTDASEMGD